MKKRVLQYGLLCGLLVTIMSCKNKEKEAADEKIVALQTYIDSLEDVKTADAEANWDQISTDFDRKTKESNDAILQLGDDVKASNQARVDSINKRYIVIKTSVEASKTPKVVVVNANQRLRNTFFGTDKIGEDMNFGWVNKDNILDTYQKFFDSYKANKSNFSREDYDEVKLIYEALDSRKNTVEKEGLSSDDNMKIASIKFKFAPMFKVNRIGAKARENEEAKE
ncbi:hypothetical protein [Flavobacterium sp. N1994]|uniref:hypothetical protein n=1 Tax=Flavobacterium sp. N1994 TaxID=2986827 RepID=UPI0022234557|nr:hypothetical protein [Flavobacterium sp. N1994]